MTETAGESVQASARTPLARAARALRTVLIVYAVLVASHLGEFWPFSIFPMFSQAGNPWTRAMAMDVTEADGADLWGTDHVPDLPGEHFAMRAHGVDQIDFANFVSKTDHWDEARIDALRHMIGLDHMRDRTLMIYRVSGGLDGPREVTITATPFLLLTENDVAFNPALPRSAYFREDP